MTIQPENVTQINPKTFTTSEIRVSGLQGEVQPIAAEFYNLTTVAGSPVAGLLVLLDRKRRPVRAELHLSTGTPGSDQDMAYRQARTLLQERYLGPGTVALSVVQVDLAERSTMVALTRTAPPSRLDWRRLGLGAAGIVAVLAIILVVWGASRLLRGGETAAPLPTVTAAAAVPASSMPVDTGKMVTAVEPSAAVPTATTIPAQLNGLPESRNALSLNIGQRVRMMANLQLTLRSEPGADAGERLGYLQDGATALIIGGPVQRQGDSDTIVWWYIRVDATGQEAWAPANTSQFTLLEPVSEE